jgi:hypothetical protein
MEVENFSEMMLCGKVFYFKNAAAVGQLLEVFLLWATKTLKCLNI